MDSFSINNVVKPYQRSNIFKGVFPCDSLPNHFSLPAIFVINLSPHTEAGSHWVATYITVDRCAFYFDSFGLPIKNICIFRFIKKHANWIDHNKNQLQHITSNKCGKFCCVFAIAILKNCSLSSFMSKFSKNLFVNDFVIENMYKYLVMNE